MFNDNTFGYVDGFPSKLIRIKGVTHLYNDYNNLNNFCVALYVRNLYSVDEAKQEIKWQFKTRSGERFLILTKLVT